MRFKLRVLLSVVILLFAVSPVLAAAPQSDSATSQAVVVANPEVKPVTESIVLNPESADPVNTRPDSVVIRLNAPLLSPGFSSTPLAKINDEIITFEDLKMALGSIHSAMAEGKSAPRKNFQDVLKRLINSRLMTQEARSIGLNNDEQFKISMAEFKKTLLQETLLNEHVKKLVADTKEVERVYGDRTREWRLKSLVIGKLADVRSFEAELKTGKSFDDVYEGFVRDERGRRGGNVEEFLARDAINPTMLVALEKLKAGETGKPIAVENGYVLYRVEEIHNRDDPSLLEQVRQEIGTQLRVAALKKYQETLTKKYVKMKKLFDKLDYESKKNKFETYLKDKRIIAEIKGEKPLTVADFSDAVAAKFFHGVQRAIDGKKVNREKKAILEELIGTMVFDKEARAQKIEQSDEYLDKVKSQEDRLLFGSFMKKVVIPEITISKDEITAYYAEHSKEYVTPGYYLLDALAFTSLEKAEEAAKTLRAGTDLKWYKSNAEGQESISKQLQVFFEGNPVTREELPIKMQQALSNSVKGDYRVFVDGITGYVLVVVEYQPPITQPYEAVENTIRQAVAYENLNKNIELWAKKLRESSEVTIYADFTQQEKP